MRKQPPSGQIRVGEDVLQARVALALPLTLHCGARPNEVRSFLAIPRSQDRDRYRANTCMQIDSISERTRQPRRVSLDIRQTTRTRVYRRPLAYFVAKGR